MAVLVSSEAGRANLITNADDSEVFVDGTSLGKVSNAGLDVPNLAAVDHDLRVIQNSDRQRFVWTYTPAPALTVYIKSDPNAGTVVIVAGQNDAEVYINDLLYKRRTDRGQIRVPNLKVGTYTVRVHKPGFVDPAPQTLIVRKAEETRAEFHLQAVPAIATLQIKGALPGTMVYVDQTLAAMISADGTASISNVKPGDHAIELSRGPGANPQVSTNIPHWRRNHVGWCRRSFGKGGSGLEARDCQRTTSRGAREYCSSNGQQREHAD